MAKEHAPLPYMKFYIEDFFNDPSVVRLTNEEVGAYLRLLRASWSSDHPGHIPSDDSYLAEASRMGTLWPAHREAIGRAFDLDSNPSFWVQKRVVREYAQARKQVAHGVEGARRRWATHRPPNGTLMVDRDRVRERDREKTTPNTSCAEPSLRESSTPAVFELPLNDNTNFPIGQPQLDRWEALYPAVDVPQTMREIIGWCEANPRKRKTRSGVLRFCAAWLSREQDKGN